MNEKRIEKIAANITAASKVVVYDIPNGFASNAEWMYKWLRHEGLNPSWGNMSDGSLRIELPQDEVSALQELQKENPARFGNWRKYEASFQDEDEDEDEDEDDEVVVCSACGSEQLESQCLLGRLGSRKHYRCRHCGITWSETVKASDGKPWKVMEITKNFYGRPLSDEIVAEFSTEAQARSYARKLEEKQEAEYSNIEEGYGGKVGISTFHVNYEASSKNASIAERVAKNAIPGGISSIRSRLQSYVKEVQSEEDKSLKKTLLGDIEDYGNILEYIEKGNNEAAEATFRNMDTISGDKFLELVPRNIRKQVAEIVGVEMMSGGMKDASIAERIARSFFANKFQRGDIVYLQRNGKATKTKVIEKHFNGGKWAYTVEGEDKPVAEAELDFK